MFYYLYEIRNNLNDKIYIGVHETKDTNDVYFGSGKMIRSAIKKYGISNFTKTILETFEDPKSMYDREREIVNDVFLLREDVYNIKLGGDGGFDHINNNEILVANRKAWTDEDRLKGKQAREAALKKYWESPRVSAINKLAYASGRNLGTKGKTFTSLKLKGHKNQTGSKNSQYGTKRKFMIKDGMMKKVLVCDIEKYMNDGWIIGYIQPSKKI